MAHAIGNNEVTYRNIYQRSCSQCRYISLRLCSCRHNSLQRTCKQLCGSYYQRNRNNRCCRCVDCWFIIRRWILHKRLFLILYNAVTKCYTGCCIQCLSWSREQNCSKWQQHTLQNLRCSFYQSGLMSCCTCSQNLCAASSMKSKYS